MKQPLSPLRSASSARGMTLVELLVSLALLATLLLLAIPSFQAQVAATRLATATNELQSTLTRARAEAMSTGRRVTVCKGDASTSTCSTSTTAGWESGWIVFSDSTRSGSTAAIDSGETPTFKVQPFGADIKITGNNDLVQYVSFGPAGHAKTMSGSIPNGTFRVCSSSPSLDANKRARDLVLIGTGRIVLTTPSGVSAACGFGS